MVSELLFSQLALFALLRLCCMLHGVWPSDGGATHPTPSQPTPPRRRRRREPKPFPGLVVFGTLEAVPQVLAAGGWQSNTAFVERINLTIRQHVAAVGRRVPTLCKGADGVR